LRYKSHRNIGKSQIFEVMAIPDEKTG